MHPEDTGAQLRVLVVDDEVALLDTVRRLFRRRFDVTTAATGAAALAHLQQARFDVALVDYMMPEMTGLELCDAAAEMAPRMARIMVTAHADLEALHAAMDAGRIHGLVAKPWTRNEILEAIHQCTHAMPAA